MKRFQFDGVEKSGNDGHVEFNVFVISTFFALVRKNNGTTSMMNVMDCLMYFHQATNQPSDKIILEESYIV